MTTPAGNSPPSVPSTPGSGSPVPDTIRLVPGPGSQDHEPDQSPGVRPAGPGHPGRSPTGPHTGRAVRPWPLLLLAMPASVAVWSGWVGIGQLTGFGQVHPLPGLWPGLRLDTAITLPVGVEAYAAYALHAWLTANHQVSARTRGSARRSAIGSLLLGMAGQIAYHLLTQAHATRAPWPITTAVTCLPVLVLGMGAALAQLIHTDTHHPGPPGEAGPPGPDRLTDHEDRADPDRIRETIRPGRLADARATAARLHAEGQRVSRRSLRSACLRGSNTELGALARLTHPPGPAGPASPA
jgi:hypothetical protein